MDFNDIQSAWDNEKTDKVEMPSSLKKIQSANTPLDKIRKNLKKEFIYQVISIVVIAFTPFIYHFPKETFFLFYLIYSLFVAICIYYLVKLYMFYKRINKTDLTTKDSLYETYFDIRLNMEIYKTFGFALTPFMVLFLVAYLFYKQKGIDINTLSDSFVITMFVVIVASVLTMGVVLEIWVRYFYGKYAKEIRKVIDELKEE
ncbi:hypothetical protein [Flavobacterium sp. C4GT6]|uniref:hypothetical protein n=1 Tax=Flavobacterium sp. C4GT6 TaxID=3103818 RepID=UPI002ED23B79